MKNNISLKQIMKIIENEIINIIALINPEINNEK